MYDLFVAGEGLSRRFFILAARGAEGGFLCFEKTKEEN